MPSHRIFACFCGLMIYPFLLNAQRVYNPNSVLANGSFYKIAVEKPGIYKIDIPFLQKLGIPGSSFTSSTIRLFGNGGQMLPEACNGYYTDDIKENAVKIVDGGDGLLNGTDYILFYSLGPDQWLKDSINRRFIHQKNLYEKFSYYFLTIGGNGLRVSSFASPGSPVRTVRSFDERLFHELDTVNFLNSGKQWYGEEFANMPGKTLIRDFNFQVPGIINSTNLIVSTSCIGRSVGTPSRFDIKINDQPAGQLLLNPIGAGTYDPFASEGTALINSALAQDPLKISFSYVPGSFNSQGWLNWFEVFFKRNLSMRNSSQLLFRDWSSVENGQVAEFLISEAVSSTRVWDITDPFLPVEMEGTISGNEYRFLNDVSRLREYIAFNAENFLVPLSLGKVMNQDLHQTSPKEYLIISHKDFLDQALRLADFHEQQNNLQAIVVTTEQIFNEFGSGSKDPVAIRDFIKMYYDKHRNDPVKPKYVLLFGDASYDYRDRVNNNTNYVPAWENPNSIDPLSTYASDDFFGFLDDNEDINSGLLINYLDVGLGRVPCRNTDDAKNFVDKVIAYHNQQGFGPWRNNITFIADDEDFNLHFQDAEILTATTNTNNPVLNQQKIYLDAFRQESGSGGSRYPQANIAINNQVYNGTLIWNYNGHGGARRLAEETILDQDIVNNWNNENRLPLFITATCDFAPYDNPSLQSIGENILLRPKTGGIALMTTTRVVFAFSNRIMNDNYLRIALQADVNGKFRSLGDAVREAKNFTYQTSADITNNRKFALLGDPAMTLGFPPLKVRPTKINSNPVNIADTLSATEKVTIEGEVTDFQGNLLTNFNGSVYPLVFDKPQTIQTLANDPTSSVASFQSQTNILFRGKASVNAGKFSFTFKVPKDINYQYGNGRLSLYAENGVIDGNGLFTGFLIGGNSNNTGGDELGPDISAFLNDEKFVNGGITNENPVLVVKLSDSSGINTAGTGIGHDIIATLDNDNNQYFVLNDFYQGDLNSYQSGIVKFQLPALEPGPHTLKIKAWDILNNSSEKELAFTVVKDEDLTISRVLNYPNPFTTHTSFWFEHNRPGQDLDVRLQIFTISGRVIKMIQRTINSNGTRSNELEWDGKDEYGDKVGRGIYLYRLSVTAEGGQHREIIEKLAIF